ncbi:MAG: flagellar basal-body MS-ring/collar protein FliF [Gammaproteobacteria bacterium]|nr:flagellar basal-body MS-ring/collar protein FliF [Gammaproteobacteria bacterium]
MDLVKVENLVESAKGMSSMPFMRQIGVMVGLAMSIGIAVAIVLWSQEPNFSVLYSNLSPKDTSAIIDVFEAADLDYKVEHESGMLLVPAERLHEARMMLAESNLPQDTSIGFELIEKEQGFGTSNFIQNARYQRAVEGELSKTIKSMGAVESARVHLALPKESAFIRDQREPGASVMLSLAQGWRLEEEQIQAIRHLVASSIPKMQPKNVTIVDAKGRLLSDDLTPNGMKLSAQQFDYTRRVESLYTNRIEQLMVPLVGKERVHAQVSAEMDFTITETTQERFNPDLPAVRSEQNVEEESTGSVEAGIPGALTNQPPGVAEAPEEATEETQTQTAPTKTRRQSTRNFELDKTISHTRQQPGKIKRLSIAVVVDNRVGKNEEGEIISIPYTPEELTRFTALVKETVGFNALRGDTVNVSNVAFTPPIVVEPPVIPFWEKNWFWVAIKQIGVVLLLLFLLFGFLRPMMKNLMAKSKAEDEDDEDEDGPIEPPKLEAPVYESNLQLAKAVAADDPKMVAQVVRTWIMADKKRGS